MSRECQRPRDQPPTCANCGGDHPANYRGCIRCPRALTVREPAETQGRSTAFVVPGMTFSRVAASRAAGGDGYSTGVNNNRNTGPPAGSHDFPPLGSELGAGPNYRQKSTLQMSPEIVNILYSLQGLLAQMSQTAQALNALLPPQNHLVGNK